MSEFSIVEEETSVGTGKGRVAVLALNRESFTNDNGKAAKAFAERYMAEQGSPMARVSDQSAAVPIGAPGTSDNDIGRGTSEVVGWQMTFKFLSMP